MLTSNGSAGDMTTIKIAGSDVDRLLETEWLLVNSRGGFSSGTCAGCNTRRYHGLLVGSLNPPANRITALSTCREVITVDGNDAELGVFEFDGILSAAGLKCRTAFRKDSGVHFDYDLGVADLTKSVFLLPDSDTVVLVYDFVNVYSPFDFSVRPLVAMRDFHALQNRQSSLRAVSRGRGWAVRTEAGYTGELLLTSDRMDFRQEGQWWYNFLYRVERDRGQDYIEDLWSPGVFYCRVDSPGKMVLWASLDKCAEPNQWDDVPVEPEIAIDAVQLRDRELVEQNGGDDPVWRMFCKAAGQFVVERRISGKTTPTILAGYPWFLDWGRDTFISLPGLLLCTERYAEAAGVLKTFARAVDDGMVPNRFDDYGNDPHYNSIDASLWFVNSAFEFMRISGDVKTFSSKLLPAVRWIVESYRKGTRFGIHADEDGLVTGGDSETQLTWMDAKCGGISFTPRYGKAVEINALWYNALCNLAEYYKDKNTDETKFYGSLAEKVADSFRTCFWNSLKGHLNDCILTDGTIDSSLRPNQIYAVSLRHCPLPMSWQQRIVSVIEKELLTPYGLRTLPCHDPRYNGVYRGDQMQRDRAYHQGTVWSHLMGPFVEAFLRVNKFDKVSRLEAAEFIQPLIEHMKKDACIGSISEIFDGDEPHRPRGCFAQAWSVAETMRAYKLIHSEE